MKNLMLGLLAALMIPAVAWAHSPLKSTQPADKAKLAELPAGISMVFGKPARLTKVTLSHTSGDETSDQRLKLPSKKFQKTFQLTPSFEGVGTYEVNWRALSEDGHALKGAFSFTVEK